MKSKTMFKHVPLCLKTRKFFYLSSLIFALFLFPAISHAAPKLFFSDLESGPKTGWEGSATRGAVVTVWGKGFGTTRGSNYVTVNGAQLTSASDYAEWGTTGTANGIPRELERITFWLSSNCADGAGTITVTVNGESTNALPFTVRSGNIYFVDVNTGIDTANGTKATNQGGNNRPWKSPKMALHSNNSVIVPGDTIYIRAGNYTSTSVAMDEDSTFMRGRDNDSATAGNPIAIVGYPGEIPVFDLTNVQRGIFSVEWGIYNQGHGADYMTFSKLKGINGGDMIGINGRFNRVIGNWFKDSHTGIWSGLIMVDTSENANIYGNYFDHNGYDMYMHNIYIKTHDSAAIGTMTEAKNVYVGWNEFDSWTADLNSDSQTKPSRGGAIEIQTDSAARSNGKLTNNIYIHDNYFHDGDSQALYLAESRNLIIYNNIFSNISCVQGGIHVYAQDSGSLFYNNTFYHIAPVSSVMMTLAANSSPYWRNNIFYAYQGQQYASIENSSFNSDYNIFYGNSLPSFAGANDKSVDPLFVNPSAGDFHLQSSSPAIDTGVNIGSPVLYDYDGSPRPMGVGYDIGAYEYNGPAVPMLQFSSGAYSVSEGAASATINVTRIGSATGAVAVSYATSNGTATSGDYTATSGTLSWANGEVTTKSFTVPITNDTTVESDETINLTLSNPTNGAILGSQSTAALTILDNDGPSTLRFENSSYSVSEGVGTATIRVLRIGSNVGAVSVNYATSNGTAIAASDYSAASNTLTWIDGDTAAKSFTIAITNDTTVESSETVNITLSNPTNGSLLGGTNPVALTITDNDSGGGGGGTQNTLNSSGDGPSGGGCGFIKGDDNGKGPRAKGEGLTFAMMLILTLAGIAAARRFSNRFSYNL